MAHKSSRWLADERDKRSVSYDDLDKIIAKDLVGSPEKSLSNLPEPKDWRLEDTQLIKAPGYWWLDSKVDPRWKAQGKGEEIGGLDMCIEAKRAFWELKKKLGNKVPWDFKYVHEPRDLKKFKLASEHIRLK